MEVSESRYWYLRNHDLFSPLNEEKLKEVSWIKRHIVAKKGEVITFADTPDRRIYFLTEGMLKLVRSDEDGNEFLKDVIHQDDIFGAVTSDAADPNEFAKVMSDKVVICSFSATEFDQVLTTYPEMALGYLRVMGNKLRHVESRYNNMVYKDVKERLLSFLKNWAQAEGRKIGDMWVIRNYLTHQDIAHLICSTRQTVTQLLNDMEKDGFLKYSRRDIRILKQIQTT